MTMRSLLLFCIAALASAQEQPPPGGTPKPFKLPPVETFALKNGLKVSMAQYGALPKVTISVRVRSGNYLEGPNQVWLSDLMSDLMKEGTENQSAEQVAEAAAGMGGQLSINVSEESTSAGLDVLSEFGPQAVRLLADVLQHPRFPDSELPRLKDALNRRLAISRSRPQPVAQEHFLAILFPDQPYGRIYPTPEMIASYTLDNVREFYNKNFGALGSHIYVAGRFDPKTMRDAITAAFSDWRKGNEPALTVAKGSTSPKSELVDRPGAAQSTLRLGLPVIGPNDPDSIPLVVTNMLLGGSFGSRITNNIREQKGYTYSPFSQVSTLYHEAYWVQSADVTTAVTGPALAEIYKEIERIRKEPPSAEELKGIQNYVSGIFVLRNSSRAGVIGQVAFVDFQQLPKDYLTNYVQRVFQVTAADVQRVSEKYLSPSKMSLVIVGDKTKIADQVKPYISRPE